MYKAIVIATCTMIATEAKSWLTTIRAHADEGTHVFEGSDALPPLEQDSFPLMSGQADLMLIVGRSWGKGAGLPFSVIDCVTA